MARAVSIRHLYEAAREGGRPLIGGHRGNPAEQPENTLASFRSAIDAGVDMIECDVHMSADGHLVVIHDDTVDRTTNGAGAIRDKTLAELRSLDAGQGERLPLLQEVVDLARDRVGLCIELKQFPVPYPGLEEKLVEVLADSGMLDQTAVISFLHPTVAAIKQLEPRLEAGILIQPGTTVEDPVALLRAASAEIYSPNWADASRELVETVHGAGGVVAVWTVDDEAAVARCRVTRPDSVFSNRPAEIARLFQ